jgi:ethanolamine ammonia-lyase small subunit
MPMTRDPWENLKSLTSARIALGRSGGSLPTRELLDFSLAHARARDAVLAPFDRAGLAGEITKLGPKSIVLSSAARSRDEYLQFPQQGRTLCEESRCQLKPCAGSPVDLAIVISDGLSALAAERQAAPLVASLLPLLARDNWQLAPIAIVGFGRVAIEDEIGELLCASLALILLGERPGLGSPDSLGAYFVYQPRPGRHDAERNCVSNIRPAGLPPEAAAATLHYLLTEARRRKLSGVALKDERAALGGGTLPAVGCEIPRIG